VQNHAAPQSELLYRLRYSDPHRINEGYFFYDFSCTPADSQLLYVKEGSKTACVTHVLEREQHKCECLK